MDLQCFCQSAGPNSQGTACRVVALPERDPWSALFEQSSQISRRSELGTPGFVDQRLDVEWQVGVESRIDWVGL